MNNEQPKLNVAIYARSASKDQSGPSKCEQQIKRAKEYLKSTPLTQVTITEYVDEGVSGAGKPSGAAFQELMAVAEKQGIDVLVITSPDRLSRDFYEYHRITKELADAGVTLLTAKA